MPIPPPPEKTKKVRILAHPGTQRDPQTLEPITGSGVQTSQGDKFHGEVVELPESEAKILLALKRAEELAPVKPKSSSAA